MTALKQSTATTRMIFMTDSADHISGKTGLTLTITASKAGGAFASITPTVTERGSGWYALTYTTGHTDTLGDLVLHITATGADPTDKIYDVVAGSLNADITSRATQTSVDTIDGIVDDILVDTGTTIPDALTAIDNFIDTEIAGLPAAVWAAAPAGTPIEDIGDEVEARLDTALTVDTYAQPTAAPATTASLKDMISWFYTMARNKLTTTSTTITLRNAADDDDIATAAHVESGGIYTRNEWS